MLTGGGMVEISGDRFVCPWVRP